MIDKALRLLGLCRRAGKLALGERAVGVAARTGGLFLILMADDASENTRKRARSHAGIGETPLLTLPLNTIALGRQLGTEQCALAGVTDIGFAQAIQAALSGRDEE